MADQELIRALRTESLYKDKATLEIMDLCMEAALLTTGNGAARRRGEHG